MIETQKKSTGIWIVILVIFLSELFFFTWCRVQCVGTEYKISEENIKFKNLSSLQNSLIIKRAQLRSPQRLLKFAEENLNLAPLTPRQTFIIP